MPDLVKNSPVPYGSQSSYRRRSHHLSTPISSCTRADAPISSHLNCFLHLKTAEKYILRLYPYDTYIKIPFYPNTYDILLLIKLETDVYLKTFQFLNQIFKIQIDVTHN